MRLSRLYARLDDITPGVLGDQTSDSQKASPPHEEGAVAVVSRSSARALEIPAPDALPEVARAFSVLWHPRQLPPAGGGTSLGGEGVAILAESAQQQECDWLGEVPAAAKDLCSAHTQNRPQHLMGHAG